jgi:tRNA(Ile)-lysidine synthase
LPEPREYDAGVFDPDAPPRTPAIAAALGRIRVGLRDASSPRLLIACSGGADSIAALGLLLILRRSERLELAVGHVDHGLRPESASEAQAVASLAATLGLPSFQTKLELVRGPGLPARARQLRQAALRGHAEQFGTTAIVLAHTATDQAETMLMHATRGAGLDGLAAMPTWSSPWLRPLLDLTRAQTRALAIELGLAFVDDPTNTDLDAPRVRIRHTVLPVLREYNPRVEQALVSLARQARDAEEACQAWAEREVLERQRVAEHEPPTSWDLAAFDRLPRAIRTRALRRMCEGSGVDPSQLRARVILAMDAAAVAVAEAMARGPGTPSPGPSRFNLRPRRVLVIDKNGVSAHQTAESRPLANH